MKIAIWGAGGVGCYYGAKLQQSGHRCTFVARGEHLRAMQQFGLTVRHPEMQFQAEVDAVSQKEWLASRHCHEFDLIVLAFKAGATRAALRQAKSWLLQGSCPVLSLQNGVENEVAILEVLGPERTLGGLAIRIGAHIQEPGVVDVDGVAEVALGCWPEPGASAVLSVFAADLAKTFNRAGIPTTLSPEIQKQLWRKLLINNGVNPLSVLTGMDTQALTHHRVYGRVVYQLMQETAAAARNRGVDIQQRDIDEMYQLIRNFDAIKTSMLVDHEKGRPLELDGICGAVLRSFDADSDRPMLTRLINQLLSDSASSDRHPSGP